MTNQENKQDEIGSRLALLFSDYWEMTAYQVSRETGISHQVLSNVVTGRSKPSVDTISSLLKRWPLMNVNWLLSGQGQPFTTVDIVLGKDSRLGVTQKESIPSLTSGAATAEHAQELASNTALRDLVESQRQQIATLTNMLDWAKNLVDSLGLGKLFSSPDAAFRGQPLAAAYGS